MMIARLPAEAGLHNARLSVTFAGESGESVVAWDQLAAPLVLPSPYRCILERRAGEIILSRWPNGADRDAAVEFSRIDVRKVFLEGAMIRIPDQDAAPGAEPKSYFVNLRPEDMCPGSGVFVRPDHRMPPRPIRERTLTWIRSAKIGKLGNASLNGISSAQAVQKALNLRGGIMRAPTIILLFALSAWGGVWLNRSHDSAPAHAEVSSEVAIQAAAARPAIETVRLPDPSAVAAAKVRVSIPYAYRRPASVTASSQFRHSRARVVMHARKPVHARVAAKSRKSVVNSKSARKPARKLRTRVADAREFGYTRKTN